MDARAEWLETDGLGGFSSGTVGGARTRRYHALLCAALAPPTLRHVLVNGFDASVDTPAGSFALSSQRYAPDVVSPDGASRLVDYANEPWPTWTYALDATSKIVQELCVVAGAPIAVLSWRLVTTKEKVKAKAAQPRKTSQGAGAILTVRPFLTGRDAHALHQENGDFRFDAKVPDSKVKNAPAGGREPAVRVSWQPYSALPAVAALANGAYRHDPLWYRQFFYAEEQARGFEAVEDCGAPGEFVFDLAKLPQRTAYLILAAELAPAHRLLPEKSGAGDIARRLRSAEKRRRATFASPLARAASQFVVARGREKSVVAGYPWFTDWGRDTFISLRGLCLATGRQDDAKEILLAWSRHVSKGMLPNVFPESGSAPEYNSVDAGLWFVIAVKELLAKRKGGRPIAAADRARLLATCAAILEGCFRGARHNIHVDSDGLLAAGVFGQQLTWMDARAYGREVTARIGKPVEVEALWINALAFGAALLPGRTRWLQALAKARTSFERRFWNEATGGLNDVVDVDHVAGTFDATVRPNQLFAVGGLPLALLGGARAKSVVATVEKKLLTPRGVRTLAPDDAHYAPHYAGGPDQRCGAYHQGTVWPWLLGPFVEAWCRVRGDSAAVRRTAARRFVQPLLEELAKRGVVHVPELADGDAPHDWKGAPAQAWSLAELLRLLRRG